MALRFAEVMGRSDGALEIAGPRIAFGTTAEVGGCIAHCRARGAVRAVGAIGLWQRRHCGG